MIAASLCIGVSLDLDTALREAVEGARALTSARYGAIYAPTVPDSPRDFVTSGLTPEEHGTPAAWPDGLRLFEHLRSLAVPRRLPDLADYARSLGCSPLPIPCRALLGMYMRHRTRPWAASSSGEGRRVHGRRRGAAGAFRAAGGSRPIGHARAQRDVSGAPGPTSRRWSRHRPSGVRRRERRASVLQPGGETHRGRAAHAGPSHRTVGGGGDLPAGRRGRGHARRSRQRRAGAHGGGRALGARRAARPNAARRDPDPVRGGGGRDGGGDPSRTWPRSRRWSARGRSSWSW